MDFNLSTAHRLSVSYNYQGQRLNPNLFGGDEPNFPGLANQANLYSAVSRGSVMLRSTLGSHLVNELRFGISNAPGVVRRRGGLHAVRRSGRLQPRVPRHRCRDRRTPRPTPRPRRATARAGTSTTPSTGCAGATPCRSAGRSRASPAGRRRRRWSPGVNLGFDTTNDPANGMFTTAFFPGAAGGDLTNARNLYALLTGRVTSITSNARLDGATGQYVYLGVGQTDEQQDEFGLFIQDSWRMRPNLTVNAGVRWQVAFPFQPNESVYSMNTLADACGVSGLGDGPGGRECNLFNPGVFNAGGRPAGLRALQRRRIPATTPSTTTSRRTSASPGSRTCKTGCLRKILGDPELGDAARQLRHLVQQRRSLVLHRHLRRRIPATRSRRTGRRRARSSRWCRRERRGRCCCASPSGSDASAEHSGVARVSDAAQLQQRREPVPSGLPDAVRAVVLVRHSAADQPADGGRGPLRRHAARPTAATTEDWNEVNWRTNGFLEEFQLAQKNLQANLASGIAGRARTRSPTSARAPARRRCRSTWRRSTARPQGRRQPGALHRHELDEQRAPERARGAQSEPRWRREQRSSRPRRSAPTWPRPAIRRTSSC